MVDILTATKEGINEQQFTAEELAQREANQVAWEEEQAKPKTPTEAERLEAVEMAILALMG